jgi:LysM domain
VSLSAHLTAGTADHGRLAFHPDCPRCRAERLAGRLAADPLVSRRAQAALAAWLLAFSAGAPAAAAQVPELDQQQATEPPAGGEPPGLQPDFDPGGDDTFDYKTAPVSGGPEAGGEEDEGLGAPVETEPPTDVEAPPVVEDAPEQPAPAPPDAAPAPVTEPAPAPAPATPPALAPAVPSPTPAPAEPPAGDVEHPAPRPEPRKATSKRKTPTRPRKARHVQRRPAIGTAPTPPPQNPAPVVQAVQVPAALAPQPAPPTTAPVSQPAEPPAGPISGPSYTARPGDSLWSIARRLLGPDASAGRIAREVNRLWRLNEDRIGTGNPSLLHVGIVLRLR